MFYAALDVSLRSVAICIIDEPGKVRLERPVSSDVPDIVRCFNEFGQPIHQVGLEAGTPTQHLTYGLTEAGFDVVCMEAGRSVPLFRPCGIRRTRTMRVASPNFFDLGGTAGRL